MSFPSVRIQEVLAESTKRHTKTPGVSFSAYRDARYRALWEFVSLRKLIYLDMNFWISLANPSRSRRPSEFQSLLEILRLGVTSGKLLCPVSYTQFTELKKQKQQDRRQLVVARLMDELSMGVGIRNPHDIEQVEFLEFFVAHVPRLKRYIDRIWAPIGHVITEVYPFGKNWPRECEQLSQKVMCDASWSMTMEDLSNLGWPQVTRSAAGKINQARKVHVRGARSFQQLFSDELVGILENVVSHIEEILGQMTQAGFGADEIEIMEMQRREALPILVQRALDPASNLVPSQRIHAALHAQLRLNDTQQFDENDLDDFRHAAVATAYCDAFFCDRPLAHFLNTPTLRKFRPTNCLISADPESAIEMLRVCSRD